MDNPTDGKNPKRRTEWFVERFVKHRGIWVRIAKKRIFTLKGAIGYAKRLQHYFPDSQYRFRHIDTADIIPYELF